MGQYLDDTSRWDDFTINDYVELRRIAESAVENLRRIGAIYSAALCGDIDAHEGFGEIEMILRGSPPDGDILHYAWAERLKDL